MHPIIPSGHSWYAKGRISLEMSTSAPQCGQKPTVVISLHLSIDKNISSMFMRPKIFFSNDSFANLTLHHSLQSSDL